jgi:hypothetical protein
LGGLLAAVLLASGCTGIASSQPPSSTSPAISTRSPTTTADPEALARGAVEATYRGWAADITAANRDPSGAFGRLAQHMSGNALKTFQVFIIDRRHRGLVGRGTPKFGALKITSLTRNRAAAQSCIDSTRFFDYRDGKLVANSAGTVRSYRLGFTLAKTWKVSSFSSKQANCAA